MLSKSLLLALIAVPLALGQSTKLSTELSNRELTPFDLGCPNSIQLEPIVLYNVSGATLMGPVQYHLIVYSDGMASLTRTAGGPVYPADLQLKDPPRRTADVSVMYLSIGEANQLVADLRRSGADGLCDQEIFATDCPLHTLTVMDGQPDAMAHTFSYWMGQGEYANVAGVMDEFIAAYFPDL